MAKSFKREVTGPSQAARTRDLLIEEDRKAAEKLERERAELAKSSGGKPGKRGGSRYRFEVYEVDWKLRKREQALGSADLKAKKKSATHGLKRGSYRVKVFNESTGRAVK